MMSITQCQTCRDLTEYISQHAPEKCMVQQEMGEVVSDELMDNYQTVIQIWIQHYASHEGNF
jgi:hypothetical protein